MLIIVNARSAPRTDWDRSETPPRDGRSAAAGLRGADRPLLVRERDYFMNLPTSFVLPPEAVDQLRAAAGQLLRESQVYQSLVCDFGGAPAK